MLFVYRRPCFGLFNVDFFLAYTVIINTDWIITTCAVRYMLVNDTAVLCVLWEFLIADKKIRKEEGKVKNNIDQKK